jgi:hypothetical protein
MNLRRLALRPLRVERADVVIKRPDAIQRADIGVERHYGNLEDLMPSWSSAGCLQIDRRQ